MNLLRAALPVICMLGVAPVQAQCFGRNACDPPSVEIRSQMSVNVPVSSQTSTVDALTAMESTRKQLYELANRECDTLHQIFGGDCTLSSVNMTSSMQERGIGSNVAFISVSNTYTVKKPAK